MNKFFTPIIMLAMLIIAIPSSAQDRELELDTVVMGFAYSNDVYYSLEDGVVKEENRSNWDIAFYTNQMSAGIITNDGAAVELYVYPNGDTSAWNSIDTNGMMNWTGLYNSEEYWEEGAFNRGASGHPDYGWGVYNMVTHSLTGDSIYVIKTVDGFYKKLWIIDKISTENTYHFRIANLDDSNQMDKELNCSEYAGKLFAYYHIETDTFLDREPEAWDLVFTKYIAIQPEGSPYSVVGALAHPTVEGIRFDVEDPSFSDWGNEAFKENRSVPGWEWKEFSMGTFSWTVFDTLVFFMSPASGDVYKMYFNGYAGMSTGWMSFMLGKVSMSDVGNMGVWEFGINVYPNPARDIVNVEVPELSGNEATLKIFNMNGQVVYQANVQNGLQQINTSQLPKGMYVIMINDTENLFKSRMIKE